MGRAWCRPCARCRRCFSRSDSLCPGASACAGDPVAMPPGTSLRHSRSPSYSDWESSLLYSHVAVHDLWQSLFRNRGDRHLECAFVTAAGRRRGRMWRPATQRSSAPTPWTRCPHTWCVHREGEASSQTASEVLLEIAADPSAHCPPAALQVWWAVSGLLRRLRPFARHLCHPSPIARVINILLLKAGRGAGAPAGGDQRKARKLLRSGARARQPALMELVYRACLCWMQDVTEVHLPGEDFRRVGNLS